MSCLVRTKLIYGILCTTFREKFINSLIMKNKNYLKYASMKTSIFVVLQLGLNMGIIELEKNSLIINYEKQKLFKVCINENVDICSSSTWFKYGNNRVREKFINSLIMKNKNYLKYASMKTSIFVVLQLGLNMGIIELEKKWYAVICKIGIFLGKYICFCTVKQSKRHNKVVRCFYRD
ncbi:hypothetical protein NUSPORA_02736 [Nucleospora cyclopteri]